MESHSAQKLVSQKCLPCEGGIAALSREEAREHLQVLPGWFLADDGTRIRRQWTTKNFMAAIRFFDAVAQLAEVEQHHPDLHLEGYRTVRIEIWTHAIGGLSINDFILAAKIDRVPIEVRT